MLTANLVFYALVTQYDIEPRPQMPIMIPNQFEFSENEGLPEILINAGFRGICNCSRKFVKNLKTETVLKIHTEPGTVLLQGIRKNGKEQARGLYSFMAQSI